MCLMNVNINPVKVLIREKYFYDCKKDPGTYREAYIFGACSIRNRALTFHAYLNNGAVFYRLPISSFCTEPCDEYSLEISEWWDAFGYDVEYIQYAFLKNFSCDVKLKDGSIHKGTYVGSFDWGNISDKNDYTFTETPDQHKCLHFINLDTGQFVLAPNNKIIWDDGFFKSDNTLPKDWLAQTNVWSSENNQPQFGGSDKYDYED